MNAWMSHDCFKFSTKPGVYSWNHKKIKIKIKFSVVLDQLLRGSQNNENNSYKTENESF
jgi:hypothetical protein